MIIDYAYSNVWIFLMAVPPCCPLSFALDGAPLIPVVLRYILEQTALMPFEF